MASFPKMGDTVKIRYECRNSAGALLEATPQDESITVILGEEMLLYALEKALLTMQPGETKEITLAPEDAFGNYRTELTGEISLDILPEDLQLEPGMIIEVPAGDDEPPMQATVTAIFDDAVEVDGNHPLAGEPLSYTLFLDSVVDQQ